MPLVENQVGEEEEDESEENGQKLATLKKDPLSAKMKHLRKADQLRLKNQTMYTLTQM